MAEEDMGITFKDRTTFAFHRGAELPITGNG
jgi:hypothetical protein